MHAHMVMLFASLRIFRAHASVPRYPAPGARRAQHARERVRSAAAASGHACGVAVQYQPNIENRLCGPPPIARSENVGGYPGRTRVRWGARRAFQYSASGKRGIVGRCWIEGGAGTPRQRSPRSAPGPGNYVAARRELRREHDLRSSGARDHVGSTTYVVSARGVPGST